MSGFAKRKLIVIYYKGKKSLNLPPWFNSKENRRQQWVQYTFSAVWPESCTCPHTVTLPTHQQDRARHEGGRIRKSNAVTCFKPRGSTQALRELWLGKRKTVPGNTYENGVNQWIIWLHSCLKVLARLRRLSCVPFPVKGFNRVSS